MRKKKWITPRKIYLNGVLTQRMTQTAYKKLRDIGTKTVELGPIYSKNLTNNDPRTKAYGQCFAGGRG